MPEIALGVHHVYKKFRKGEVYDTLRDLIPSLVTRVMRNGSNPALSNREFWALQDVTFEVKRGEAVGIIGHNGAGKSTVLKLLTGIMGPTTGNVCVHGSLSSLIEIGAGLHPDLTGRENIYLIGTVLGMRRHQIKRKFDEIVAFSELEEFLDTPVKRYSSGMHARLGFSVAAHVEPDVLVVDEVLSVGDYVFQSKCIQHMKDIIRRGATVVFVSHHLKAVADLCHRCILLDRGRVLKDGDANLVIREYLARGAEKTLEDTDKEVYVSRVVVRSGDRECLRFDAGDVSIVDVEVGANSACSKVAVAIHLRDEVGLEVFSTSTERLGKGTLTLKPGERAHVRFRLHLHLARGTYHLGVALYRYDIEKRYDLKFPSASLYVGDVRDVRGIANLYPEVLE